FEDVGARIFSISRNGNLGVAVLKKFNLVFDYNRSSLYLRPGIGFKSAFEHDMSGLELASGGEKFDRLYITRVEPGSAADASGLMPNDEILAINFKPVKDMAIDEIDELLRSKADRSFILDIAAPGA